MIKLWKNSVILNAVINFEYVNKNKHDFPYHPLHQRFSAWHFWFFAKHRLATPGHEQPSPMIGVHTSITRARPSRCVWRNQISNQIPATSLNWLLFEFSIQVLSRTNRFPYADKIYFQTVLSFHGIIGWFLS